MRHLARGRGGRAARERRRLLDEERRELRRCGRRSGGRVGPEMESAAIASPAGPEHGRGHRGQPELELVDRASRSRARGRAAAPGVSFVAPPKARKHLPFAASSNGDAPADPVGHADEVGRVLLGEVLDAARTGDGEVDRLAGCVGEPAQRGLRPARRGSRPRRGSRSGAAPGPGRSRPRSPRRWTSPCRSSAPTSREVVLFGRPGALRELADATAARRTRRRARAAAPRGRSPACRFASGRLTMWNSCSTN